MFGAGPSERWLLTAALRVPRRPVCCATSASSRRCFRASGTRRTTAPSTSRSRSAACGRCARPWHRARGLGHAHARPVRVRRRRRLLHGRAEGRRRAAVPVARRRRLSEHLPRRLRRARAAAAGARARMGSALWLDGLVCALASAALGAALVLGVVASTEGSFAAVATNLAYPLGDLIMLAFVIAVMVITGRSAGSTWRCSRSRSPSSRRRHGVPYQVAVGTYREYTLLDTGWPAAYVLVAIAACRPAERLDTRRLRGGMLVVPATFTLIALAHARLRPLHAAARGRAVAGDRHVAAAVAALRAHLPREPPHARRQRDRGRDRRADRPRQPARAARRPRARWPPRPLPSGPCCSRSSTSTASRPTTTASATRPATRCCTGSAATWPTRSAPRGTAYRMGGDEFCLLAPAATSTACSPAPARR